MKILQGFSYVVILLPIVQDQIIINNFVRFRSLIFIFILIKFWISEFGIKSKNISKAKLKTVSPYL